MTRNQSRFSIVAAISLTVATLGLGLAATSASASAAATTNCVNKTLRKTTKGDMCVYNMQRLLQRADATSLATDSYYGNKTEAAVKRFQTDTGIATDGVVGRETWRELCTDEQVVNPGTSKRAVQTLRIADEIGCGKYWTE